MPDFQFQAIDQAGKTQSGKLEADSEAAARVLLQGRDLFPISITASSGDAGLQGSTPSWLSHRLRESELTLLSSLWAALLESGLTLEQALTAMMDQTERLAARSVLAEVRADIVAGYSLRAALDRHPSSFPAIYRASVAAGEQSGQLALVMKRLAAYQERRAALRRKTLQAFLYPAIVAVLAVVIIVALLTYVVPQVVGVFQQSRQTLPWLTRALMTLSGGLQSYGWLLALALLAAWGGAHWALREKHLRRAWDKRLLAMPVLGTYLRSLDAARFSGTLAILAGSGVPLLAALDAGRQVTTRIPIQEAISALSELVREGVSLSRALKQQGSVFPPLLSHMAANGETTGRLQEALERAASLLQDENEQRTSLLTTLLEPLLLLFMGVVVLLIVLAVMQPIIELNTLIK